MKLLLLHNFYQLSGGEDTVYHSEKALLERAGVEVVTYERRNDEINHFSPIQTLGLVGATTFSKESFSAIKSIIQKERPQIAHFHNTFPLISPSGYYACQDSGIPVVQTIHNYRLLCSNALLYRDGHICEECLGKTPPWPGMKYGCYQDSRGRTLVLSSMLTIHRVLHTWKEKVDVYIALTEFSRNKLIEGGLPAEKISVKPNFVSPDPGKGIITGNYGIVVGRLSREKGIETVMKAWNKFPHRQLIIVGDGPLKAALQTYIDIQQPTTVKLLGWVPRENTFEMIKEARFMIFPSMCYENFPLSIVEAYACGKPVIASNLGAAGEIVKDGFTGLLYEPGDVEDLVEKIDWMFSHPDETEEMGDNARLTYEKEYSADTNLERLSAIYQQVVDRRN